MNKLLLIIALAACNDRAATQTTVAPSKTPETDKTQQAFTNIYQSAVWGTNDASVGNSGTGSTAEATVEYRALLQKLLAEKKIHSVVDAGCGDWEFSQLINWTGIDYRGYDIVPSVVEQDKQRFAKPGIQFFVGNIVDDDLPAADLLISKHVLQHLPNKDVTTFLKKQLPKYKYALIINGTDGHPNAIDIEPGGYRTLDITRPPFDVAAETLLMYSDNRHLHKVVLVTRDGK